MKNSKTLLVYAVVAALLGGYIYFFERGPVKGKKDEEKPLKVFDHFVADDITQIHLENLATTVNAQKSPIDIQKDEKGTWQIVSPKQLPADETMVRTLLSGVGDYTPDSSVDNPANLADFGLKTPRTRSVFKTKGGTSFEILVGDKNAAGSSNYVQASGKTALFLIPSGSVESLGKTVDDFRDHNFVKTDLVLAKKVRVTRGAKVFEFEKDKNNTWNITKPIEEKAEESKIRDLLNNANGLRIESFVSDKAANLSAYGLAKPHAKMEIWPADGGPSKAILLGKKKDKGGLFYGKTEDLPAVYLVQDYFEKATDIKASDFRDRSVMKFDAGAAQTLSVKRGAQQTVYQKSDKGLWTAPGRANANDEGANIASQLSSTTILDFAAKDAVTGLAEPSVVVEVTLNDKSSRLFRFGRTEKNQVYLASDKNRDVYLVSPGILSQLDSYFSAVLNPNPTVKK